MTEHKAKLQDALQHLYSEEVISESELNQMADDLIKFCALGMDMSQRANQNNSEN